MDAITPIPGSKFYNLDLTVIYTGADYLYVEKSEEYSDIVDTHFFYIPYIVHLRFEYIYMIGTSWVDLRISNKIGKAYYTVEIPSQLNLMNNSTQIRNPIANSNIVYMEVRDIQGRIILQTKDYEDVNHLSKGIYIMMITYADGEVVTKKIYR